MMKKICLLNIVPSSDPANYPGYSQGLGIISSLLKQESFETFWIHLSSINDIELILESMKAEAIFVYLTTNAYSTFCKVHNQYYLPAQLPVFVGGPHAIALPEELASIEGISGVCAGEGELATLEIARRLSAGTLDYSGIPNLYYKSRGKILIDKTGCVAENLDNLPFPDRIGFPYNKYLTPKIKSLVGFEFMATRGCKYGCRFCLNPRLLSFHGKKMIRRRSVDNVISEVKAVTSHFKYKGLVGFHDDIFTLDKEWLKLFASKFSQKISLPFWCNSHIKDLNEENIKILRQAGCVRILLGIECGNEKLRTKILGKKISNKEILEKVALLHKHHIKIVATFMLGFPGECEDHIIESIMLCKKIRPAWVLLSSLCPFPGTKIYKEAVEEGLLNPDFYKEMNSETFYSPNIFFNNAQISKQRLAYYYQDFRKLACVL